MSRSLKFAAVLSAAISAGASGTVAQTTDQSEVFDRPAHLHDFVCDQTGTAILKVGIDFSISMTDVKRLNLTPETFSKIIAPHAKRLSAIWHNAWVDSATQYPARQTDIQNSNSPLAQAADVSIATELQRIESATGITIRVLHRLEGFAASLDGGLDCNIPKLPVPAVQ